MAIFEPYVIPRLDLVSQSRFSNNSLLAIAMKSLCSLH
jgi:hypothetical protein